MGYIMIFDDQVWPFFYQIQDGYQFAILNVYHANMLLSNTDLFENETQYI